MIIAHNMEAFNAQRNLNITNSRKGKSTEKLSSGYRINRSADDAAGLSISEKMRGQIRGLNQASENIQDGNSLVNTADGGLMEVHSIMQRERELMVQAANDTYCKEDREAIEKEIKALTSELDRIYEQTEFNTIKIFKGNYTYIGDTAPVENINTDTSTKTDNKTRESVIWLPKDSTPPADSSNVYTSSNVLDFHTSYSEYEKDVYDPDDPLHPFTSEVSEYLEVSTVTETKRTIERKYESLAADSKYTTLRNPGDMTGSNGYINVQNVARDLDLSCAMSQLGVKIDGKLVNVDLYNSGRGSTVVSDDEKTATTTYKGGALGDIEIDQVIKLVDDGKAYDISYKARNTSADTKHTIDLRLAFDVMNTYDHTVSTETVNVNNTYELENEDAKIGITPTGADKFMITDIADLYDAFDDSKVVADKTGIYHTGAGFWWNNKEIAEGRGISIGSVKYGPIELKKTPYKLTETDKTETTKTTTTKSTTTSRLYKAKYIDIQAGANSNQLIPIRLWDLSTESMKCMNPDNISAFNAQDSLTHLDRVIDKVSEIRSYYGAITNRLEHAMLNADNMAENLSASESRIRDLDMAEEMLDFSTGSILQQAGQSVLAQANQSRQGILSLLQ